MDQSDLWVIVLAAGDGRRGGIARGGKDEPPQFAGNGRSKSLFRLALERATKLVPLTRVVVTVSAKHRRFWSAEMAALEFPGENVVVQPEDRGSAVELLLGLLSVLQRQRNATIVVLPATHWVEDEQSLQEGLERSLRELRRIGEGVILLGIAASDVGLDSDWIVPWPSDELSHTVRSLETGVEIAGRDVGALCNTMMLTATGMALLRAYERGIPGLLRAFSVYLRIWDGWNPWVTDALYQVLPSADLPHDLFAPSLEALRVLPITPCGWSDLRTASGGVRRVTVVERPMSQSSTRDVAVSTVRH